MIRRQREANSLLYCTKQPQASKQCYETSQSMLRICICNYVVTANKQSETEKRLPVLMFCSKAKSKLFRRRGPATSNVLLLKP